MAGFQVQKEDLVIPKYRQPHRIMPSINKIFLNNNKTSLMLKLAGLQHV